MKSFQLFILSLFVFCSVFMPSPAQEASFSLEQVMSASKPSDGVASPDHKRFAWIVSKEGVRNLWVAEAPGYEARRMTDKNEDLGRDMGQLAFDADGSHVFYVWGGSANRSGEHPNPTHHPEGGIQEIRMVSVEKGTERRIASGSSPAPSPDGKTLAFIRDGQVWSVQPDKDTAEPARMFQIRGGAGSLEWSPDGSRLAFVSYRGDHSFIGVYDVEEDAIEYLSPSVDQDRHPVWSPGGDRLAYIRIPHETLVIPYFTPRREGLPWSIRVHDFTRGTDREVWKADPGKGSVFHSVYADKQLMWAAGDRLVFPWEKTGWAHLYALSLSDGSLVHLTPGQHEVHFPSLSPDKGKVVYTSNLHDMDRRHLWQVDVQEGDPQMITSGRGLEWGGIMMKDGGLIFAASTGTKPAHVEYMPAGGDRRLLNPGSIPDDFPEDEMRGPEQVIFSATDGKKIHGQLFLPEDYDAEARYPAILFFHGGSRRQMLLGFHHSGYYHNCFSFNQFMANRGYIVLSVNYRSGIGYGMKFREAWNFGAAGASEFHDVMGAGLYLRNRADVNGGRIGLWGGSYGGYLTALGLARASDLFKAGVDLHGVHDWNVAIEHFNPSYNPLEHKQASETAFRASPMASVDDWRSPVLLVHGDDDRNVPFSETVDLVEALRKREVEVEQLIFPDEVHGFVMHEHWMEAFRAAADFFDRHLK